MALLKGHKRNFETLQQAFANGDVALMECHVVSTGETVAVICAVTHLPNGEFQFTPFASLFNTNPYEILIPPGAET